MRCLPRYLVCDPHYMKEGLQPTLSEHRAAMCEKYGKPSTLRRPPPPARPPRR